MAHAQNSSQKSNMQGRNWEALCPVIRLCPGVNFYDRNGKSLAQIFHGILWQKKESAMSSVSPGSEISMGAATVPSAGGKSYLEPPPTKKYITLCF